LINTCVFDFPKEYQAIQHADEASIFSLVDLRQPKEGVKDPGYSRKIITQNMTIWAKFDAISKDSELDR
jgi:hypothetical protein